jgi:hypothetical protein
MRTVLVAVLLLAFPAMADTMKSYAVLTSATKVFTPSASNGAVRSLKVVNRGANAIYCSPESDVTTDTGDPIASGASAAYPGVTVWCIASVAQAGTGTDRTLVWESDS